MKGSSISSRRPLRNLDRDGPVGVLLPLAARGLEVQLLQALGDWPYAARPDGTVVHLDDGRYLEPRPREEDLVRGVELRAVRRTLYNRHPELLSCQLHNGVTRYALQDVRRYWRGWNNYRSVRKRIVPVRLSHRLAAGVASR